MVATNEYKELKLSNAISKGQRTTAYFKKGKCIWIAPQSIFQCSLCRDSSSQCHLSFDVIACLLIVSSLGCQHCSVSAVSIASFLSVISLVHSLAMSSLCWHLLVSFVPVHLQCHPFHEGDHQLFDSFIFESSRF